jgi:periplasmic divalent cation tolerance protein
MDHVLVYVTCADMEEAERIGGAVVKERLAACANVIPGMKSVYFWGGKLQKDDEVVLILKTKKRLVEKLTKRVKQLHSYEVPCVMALPIVGGNPDFLEWIEKEAGEEES